MQTIDRRTFLAAVGAGAAGWMAGAAAAQPATKPNIVFILADDLGRHQVNCYGNPFYETPRIDALAAQGVRFTDAYAACPVCSPTRASIMTGKYPARLHITDYIPGNVHPHAKLKTPEWSKELPLDEVTLAEMLQQAGYVSGHFGKWHLGKENDVRYVPGEEGTPETQGFADVYVAAKPDTKETPKACTDPDYDAHHARAATDRAIAFMQANKDRPFFCYIGHNLIHRPEMAYGPDIVKYARKPEASNEKGNNPILGAMVEMLDTQVGRVVDAVDELGIADNTVLIFFSDNGDFWGETCRKPLYGSKADLYEGGIREPLIIRWPAKVKAGTTCSQPVASIDFFPTFAQMAGVTLTDPTIDGISIQPALTQSAPLARQALYWHYPHYHAIGAGPSGAIREGKYKLIEWFEKSIDGLQTEGALELFDLEADLGETNNLAAAMPEKAMDLYEKLRAWRKAVNAQEMPRNDQYDPSRASVPN